MIVAFLIVGLTLGPLLLARFPRLGPAPGGIVVSPTAPKLDMRVVYDASDARSKPLVATLTGQRPQPANAEDTDVVVTIEPQVQLATPEALDRIAAALEREAAIAVFPWQKTSRAQAFSSYVALFDGMTLRHPTGLVARRAPGSPRKYLGGHVVAEHPAARRSGPREPLAVLGAMVFFAAAALAAIQLVVDPSWANVGWYAAAVFSTSLCIRQVGKYARLATLVYPVALLYFVASRLRRGS